MSEENSQVMRGITSDDPSCIHTVEELEKLVDDIGFLPLFAGNIKGFSVKEHTESNAWWTGDPEYDPWEWRVSCTHRGHLAYGKFFGGRAGFISKAWLPVFANYRRDGYDFDARWDDELASIRQKKIMDLFMEENADRERFTSEVKQKAGFGKDGEKNFEGTVTGLEMALYLVIAGFRQRKNRKGESYGWSVAVLATPEHIFGRELVTRDYDTDPKESLKKITDRVKEYCPDASKEEILRLVGYAEDRPASKKNEWPYPLNLLKAIDKDRDPDTWTKDEISGLYVALGQLRPKQQRVLFEKYHDGKKNDRIGAGMNRAPGTIGTYHGKALWRLRTPLVAAWYRDGYQKNLRACAKGQHWTYPLPETGEDISEDDLCLRIGLKVDVFEKLAGDLHILTIRDLVDVIAKNAKWYQSVHGIGPRTAEDIEKKLAYFGFRAEG